MHLFVQTLNLITKLNCFRPPDGWEVSLSYASVTWDWANLLAADPLMLLMLMIVIMTLILLSCGDCCGGGNYATAKGGSLAMRPSALCSFFCATWAWTWLSKLSVLSQAQGRWRQTEDNITRKSIKVCLGWPWAGSYASAHPRLKFLSHGHFLEAPPSWIQTTLKEDQLCLPIS